MSEVNQPPGKGRGRQVSETVGGVALAAIPYAGGPLSVLWVKLVGSAYERRRQAWEREVVDAVNDLIRRVKGLDEADIADNDQFLDAVAAATAAAVSTSQREKLEALRNTVLNTALPSDLDADTQAVFLRNVRDFTPSHLRLLKLLDDPPRWYAERGIDWPIRDTGSVMQIVQAGIPELTGREDMCMQLSNDLTSAGLTTSGLTGIMTSQGLRASRTSPSGRAFLQFITDPRDRYAS